MQRVFEKICIDDVSLDATVEQLSIGDELKLTVSPEGFFMLFCKNKRGLLSRLLLRRSWKYLGRLSPRNADDLTPRLAGATKIRIRVVDISPKHLSGQSLDRVFVSIWLM